LNGLISLWFAESPSILKRFWTCRLFQRRLRRGKSKWGRRSNRRTWLLYRKLFRVWRVGVDPSSIVRAFGNRAAVLCHLFFKDLFI